MILTTAISLDATAVAKKMMMYSLTFAKALLGLVEDCKRSQNTKTYVRYSCVISIDEVHVDGLHPSGASLDHA
jgi:hypothetical protein